MSLIERAIGALGPLGEGTPGGGVQPPAGPGRDAAHGAVESGRSTPGGRVPLLPARKAELDFARLRAAGLLLPDEMNCPLGREMRVLKRPVLRNAFAADGTAVADGRCVAVTSSLPGEGKTFFAICLAMSVAAELDHSVILVDGDVAKPSLLARLGVSSGLGLLDRLEDPKLPLSDLLVETNVRGLTLMASGRQRTNATELLASAGMMQLRAELLEEFPDSLLLFDSPPLLPSTEARVIATLAGQVVMVVEAGRTPRAALTDALAQIEELPVVNLVLNKFLPSFGGPESGYGYGYGYGYGHGTESGQAAPVETETER